MRKFLNFQLIAASLFAFSISLTSCQKDQDVADEATSESSTINEMNISSQAVNGTNIRGLISKETAERMGQNFNKTYKTKNGTEYVGFSSDMSNYLQQLKDKYKSDSVYVSFGVYDEKTAVNKKDVGRITVFFMGKNNNKNASGNIKSQRAEDDDASNYFNHGSIWP